MYIGWLASIGTQSCHWFPPRASSQVTSRPGFILGTSGRPGRWYMMHRFGSAPDMVIASSNIGLYLYRNKSKCEWAKNDKRLTLKNSPQGICWKSQKSREVRKAEMLPLVGSWNWISSKLSVLACQKHHSGLHSSSRVTPTIIEFCVQSKFSVCVCVCTCVVDADLYKKKKTFFFIFKIIQKFTRTE